MPNITSNMPDTNSQDGIMNIQEQPQMLEEIVIEELSIDGICGVY
jgi:mycofactocin precursor